MFLKFLKECTLENNVIQAEMIFASFIIEYNLPIASTELAGPQFHTVIVEKKCLKKNNCCNKIYGTNYAEWG